MSNSNTNLAAARKAKNDEFYTRYEDVAAEMQAYLAYDGDMFRDKTVLCPCDDPSRSNFTKYFTDNFCRLGLRKLISTSYANGMMGKEIHGRIRTISRDATVQLNIPIIEHDGYLEGSGDFRSDEVTALRDEADFIITNPPFSLFSDFIAWVMGGSGHKQFAAIGNMNAITYGEVFPLVMADEIWLGTTKPHEFMLPDQGGSQDGSTQRFGNIRWYTNISHGIRHTPVPLMTAEQNICSNARLRKKLECDYGHDTYPRYDNYDALEVPFVDCIPSDYDGIMGVPITFVDRHCPEQFKIVGATESEGTGFSNGLWDASSKVAQPMVCGRRVYKRLFICPCG